MEDDEIIVGINVKQNNNKKNKAKNKKVKNKKKSKQKNNKIDNSNIKNRNNSKNKSKAKTPSIDISKKKKRKMPFKSISIIILFIILLILIFSSSLFNIKTINVNGNVKLSDDKVISLSSLQFDTNIFKFNKSEIENKIKENAYIEKVEISRKVPSTVEISVEEREVKYMLQFADSYVYINNQGYMLEISNEKLDVPVIVGFTTDLSNIKAGNRIDVADLKKMNMVIKIYETAKDNDLGDLISKIDISNPKNYTIVLEKEGKTVYLGDCSDLNTRIIYLKAILEANEGKSGTIFLNVDLNKEKVYFRPNSN